MEPYRIYIDESGDHAYKNVTEHDYEKRYLGLTGVLIQTAEYVNRAQPALEQLKRNHFRHDPDHPEWTFLHRYDIIDRSRAFGVLRERSLTRFSGQFTCRHHAASAAAAGLLSYSTGLRSPIEV